MPVPGLVRVQIPDLVEGLTVLDLNGILFLLRLGSRIGKGQRSCQ